MCRRNMIRKTLCLRAMWIALHNDLAYTAHRVLLGIRSIGDCNELTCNLDGGHKNMCTILVAEYFAKQPTEKIERHMKIKWRWI
jgi:hypothetical protein